MALSNLPPGVTDAMIEAYFGGPECDECGEYDCQHIDDAAASAESAAEDAAMEDYYERKYGGE